MTSLQQGSSGKSTTLVIEPPAPACQHDCARQQVEFLLGTTSMVFTDQLSHAAISGQIVVEQTFAIGNAGMVHSETSPLRVLDRLMGKKLH